MNYQGDISLGDTIDFKFTTVTAEGVPATISGSPVVSAYVDNSTTQITAGVTLTVDFDGVVGLHNVRIVATSGNGFAAATDIYLAVTAGTVDGVSVVGYVVGSFSIQNRYTTAAGGDASQATLLAVKSQTDQMAFTSGKVHSHIKAIDNYVITGQSFNYDLFMQYVMRGGLLQGTATAGSTTTVQDIAYSGFGDTNQFKGLYILFTSGGVVTQCRLVTSWNPTTSTFTFTPPTTQAVAVGVTFELLHSSSATLVSDYDAAKTAASQTSVDAIGSVVDTEIAAIKAKTDALPTDPADASDIAALFATVNTKLDDMVNNVWSKAMTELTSVPGVSATVLQALEWVFLLSRNKITQTGTTQSLRNDVDGATIASSTVNDDGTTFTRGEFV